MSTVQGIVGLRLHWSGAGEVPMLHAFELSFHAAGFQVCRERASTGGAGLPHSLSFMERRP